MSESAADKLAYVKSSDVILVRRKHRIGFQVGEKVSSLIEKLSQLPPHAEVDEVIDDTCWECCDGITTIEFHEETRK